MEAVRGLLEAGKNNFIFLGEAGCGKSEIALNFARYVKEEGKEAVHFFDMDMTKPLFRSRDVCRRLEAEGITVHYEEQFMDAPTLVGGARRLLKSRKDFVVMDVGGDDIGARSIGGLMSGLDREETVIYYVLNAFRPWSEDLDHIDGTLGKILSVTHLELQELHWIDNPNLGCGTTLKEVEEGHKKMKEMFSFFSGIDFICIRKELCQKVKGMWDIPVMPLHLYLTYPWLLKEEAGCSLTVY